MGLDESVGDSQHGRGISAMFTIAAGFPARDRLHPPSRTPWPEAIRLVWEGTALALSCASERVLVSARGCIARPWATTTSERCGPFKEV
jgi:hypothetical protein